MPRSMARPRRRRAAPAFNAAPPATVSRAALLIEGSDAEFRGLIHDLIAYGHRLDTCRDAFAAIVGISGAQYEILMLVSRAADLLAVGEVATRLHRSGAFITIEANKLVARGILEKVADPRDGRRVLLRANQKSRELLERLDAKRFRQLRLLARDLVESGDRAVAMLDFMLHDSKAA